MINRLKQALPYILIAPAVLPLVYISGVLYPYVTPKTFLLQGIGMVALAAFAYLTLAGQPFFFGRLRARATWIPALLLIVTYVTSFFGIDFSQSFWGIFARGDSLLTSTVITIFFYLIVLSADRTLPERLIKLVAMVAGVVAAIAVLQWSTTMMGGGAWFLPPVSGRIGSTLGNAAFLAGYLGMALFVILIALRDSFGFWRRIYTSAAILSVLAIIFAATRGTILALLVSGTAALIYAALRRTRRGAASKGNETTAKIARYGLIALVLCAGFFFLFRSELSHSSFEPIARIASISLSDGTVSSRLFVWSHILDESFQRPFVGYGAEHITQLFDKVYDPGNILEQWFDRSHNAFLDYFAQYGIFGFASYLALIGAFAASALRLYKREEEGLMNYGFLFLLLILTYTVQNFFVFDTPSSLWLLYALFAILIVLLSEESATPLFEQRISPVVSRIIPALVVLCIVPTVMLPLYANILLTKGYLFHLVDVKQANAYFGRGLALNTYADFEYGYQAYDMYTGHQATALSGEDRIAAYDFALSVLTANFKKYPYDARTATYLGHVIDTAPPEAVIDDVFDEQVLSRAMELSPLRAQPWYMTANISLRKADKLPYNDEGKEKYFREAITILEDYARKEISLPTPRYILANLYYKLGDVTMAKKWADEALPLYTRPDTETAGPAVKYYLIIEDWRNAARFLADLVEKNPSDYDVLYDLAKVTYLAGDPATAERIVQKLRTEDPAILGTDQNFLNAITAYESR